MTGKKRKLIRRTPDLTVEGDSLTVFMDKPRGGSKAASPGIVTSYDPSVPVLAERVKLARILEECLRVAAAIKNKRGTELLKLLRDARRQVGLIGVE